MLTPNVTLKGKRVLITGAAGFIGASLVKALLENGDELRLVGLDSVNDYYDPAIKEYRIALLEKLSKEHSPLLRFFSMWDLP